jgi:transposase
VLRTGAALLTDRQHTQLVTVFADDRHVEVRASWGIYQRIVAAYRHPDRAAGKTELTKVIAALRNGVPKLPTELITLGRTVRRRSADVLAYFDRPGQQRPHRSHQRPTRAPARHRARLPQPRQLHHPSTARHRRIQTG